MEEGWEEIGCVWTGVTDDDTGVGRSMKLAERCDEGASGCVFSGVCC